MLEDVLHIELASESYNAPRCNLQSFRSVHCRRSSEVGNRSSVDGPMYWSVCVINVRRVRVCARYPYSCGESRCAFGRSIGRPQ